MSETTTIHIEVNRNKTRSNQAHYNSTKYLDEHQGNLPSLKKRLSSVST